MTTNPYWVKKADDQPWLQLSITPALYAGPVLDSERAIRPLVDAGAVCLDDGRGNQFIVSHDGRIRLGFVPQNGTDAMWKIAVHDAPFEPPQWTVCLTDHTPIEIVEAITTDLASKLRSGARLHGSAADSEWRSLFQPPEWTTTWDARAQQETVVSMHAPQDRIVLDPGGGAGDWEEAGQDGFWTVTIGDEYEGWCAAASTSTPDRILHAIAGAMLGQATRDVGELSNLTIGAAVIGAAELIELPPSPTPLDVQRGRAARTRSPLPTSPGSGSAPPAVPRATPPTPNRDGHRR
ncbi:MULTISPECIES: DUF317 domain-containing protein [unclassified Kitasatospora]|uniref:DUF317 domain-containing protein n=1 Tax=unclassified Kitasatospora TaxID=2633591 RepID=UPI0034004D57